MNCTKLRNFAALCCKQIVDFFSDLTSYYHVLQNEIANLVTSSFQVHNASTLSREDRAELFWNNKQIPANFGHVMGDSEMVSYLRYGLHWQCARPQTKTSFYSVENKHG